MDVRTGSRTFACSRRRVSDIANLCRCLHQVSWWLSQFVMLLINIHELISQRMFGVGWGVSSQAVSAFYDWVVRVLVERCAIESSAMAPQTWLWRNRQVAVQPWYCRSCKSLSRWRNRWILCFWYQKQMLASTFVSYQSPPIVSLLLTGHQIGSLARTTTPRGLLVPPSDFYLWHVGKI